LKLILKSLFLKDGCFFIPSDDILLTMDYLKIIINTGSAPDWFNESLIVRFGETGFESFEDTETGINAFIPEKSFSEPQFLKILSDEKYEWKITWQKEIIKDQNWNEVWEKNYFKPLVIKDKCLVRAPFHTDYPICEYEIVIEPNMAFGTGNHETTSMMIEILLEEGLAGKTVLDMGCGTGILSIISSMLGAEKIVAIDIDEWSFKGTSENARLNNIANIIPFQGDASLLDGQKFDFILANIQRNVLLADMEKYLSVLNPDGKLIMSGFYLQDIPAIKEKAESLGLADAGYIEKNKWVAYTFKK
jgi:ribosomal protein L11 methyltransferase